MKELTHIKYWDSNPSRSICFSADFYTIDGDGGEGRLGWAGVRDLEWKTQCVASLQTTEPRFALHSDAGARVWGDIRTPGGEFRQRSGGLEDHTIGGDVSR